MPRTSPVLRVLGTLCALCACAKSPDAPRPPAADRQQPAQPQTQAGESVVDAVGAQPPFQLEAFTAICTYHGSPLAAARATAVASGCNAVTVDAGGPMPPGVRAHIVMDGRDWGAWLAAHGSPADAYASLVQVDTTAATTVPAPPGADTLLTLRPAWRFLEPSQLANQPWFTFDHADSAEERAAAEGSYYGGCVRAITGETSAAAIRGWKQISLAWDAAPGLDGWIWERIAGPASAQAGSWTVTLPTASGFRAAAATLATALARPGGGSRRVRAAIPLAGLGIDDARALAALPCFSGAEGLELRVAETDRVSAAVLAAALEGLALAKSVEPILAAGRPVADGPDAADQPLVRRISHGERQAVMTYDPAWSTHGAGRQVVITGPSGTAIRLPAGRALRVFVLGKETTGPATQAPSRAAGRQSDDPVAVAALQRLTRLVPHARVLELPGSGTIDVPVSATLTVNDLRGLPLDEDPPVLGQVPSYPPGVGDGLPPEEQAYRARDIAPFRFRHFTNELVCARPGAADFSDYASTHGFNVLGIRPRTQNPHLPKGTGAMFWHSRARPKSLIEDHRYDRLADLDLEQIYATDPYCARNYGPRDPGIDQAMVDIEDPVLSPEGLRQQPWYPKDAPPTERGAFEERYYRGFSKLYTAAIATYRRLGYPTVSVYGWYLVPRKWFGLDTLPHPRPETDWAWNAIGRHIYPQVDIIHPSVYCFYVSAQNVAYTLANLDLTRGFIEALPERKPMRPYYWLLYHGGGAGGLNWWRNQPIVDEEVRAMHALSFFTGIGGFALWCEWKDARFTGIPDPAEDKLLMVGRPFACVAEAGGEAHPFQRYDVVQVLSCDRASGETRFQRIARDRGPGYGIGDGNPVFRMDRADLRRHLRPWLENAAAMTEGMALAYPFEYLLRHGSVRIDVPAQEQFAKVLPIVRRVTLGSYHVIITYNPNVLYARLQATGQGDLDAGTDHRLRLNLAAAGTGITLADFDGHPGLTLRLPADDQPRIIVVRTP